jgi:integrase
MRHEITQKFVGSLAAPEGSARIFFDAELRGFGIRITPNGVKTFVLDYKGKRGERRCRIGQWPEMSTEQARTEAGKMKTRVRDGKDPLDEERATLEEEKAEPTMKELCEDYMEQWAIPHKKPSSQKQDRRMIDTRVLPTLGELKISAVIKRDIKKLHNSLRATPYEANRVKSLLSKMFSLAIEDRLRTDNPCKGIKRFDEPKHEFWLSVEQFQRMELALNEYEQLWAADAIRLLALTGCREGEGLNATWPQFNLTRGTWTKPSHATKEKKTEIIPLNENALALLRRMAKQRDPKVEWLFPADGGERAHTTLRNAWRMVCRNAGLAKPYHKQGKRGMLKRWKPTIRINDLRHSFASHLVSSGQSLYEVGKLMGHTQASTTQRYAHIADTALRAVTNKFSVFGNVVEMPKLTA